MDSALLKILLLAADEKREASRPLTANAVLLPALVRQALWASGRGVLRARRGGSRGHGAGLFQVEAAGGGSNSVIERRYECG